MSTAAARMRLIEQYGNGCLRCGLEPGEDAKPLAVDHIIPVARGGRNNYGNYQLLCGPCNSWKGTKVIDFRPGERKEIDAGLPIIPLDERVRKSRPVTGVSVPGLALTPFPFVDEPTTFGTQEPLYRTTSTESQPVVSLSFYEEHMETQLKREKEQNAWARQHIEHLSEYWKREGDYTNEANERTDRAHRGNRIEGRFGCTFFILFWIAVAVAVYLYIY